ncbi:MAG TPA: hypothetical protein VKA87_09770 [Nitrososphaeraceae archaeon]|nr:hypothetical protein [Nitrososphaeraceae archaeon]
MMAVKAVTLQQLSKIMLEAVVVVVVEVVMAAEEEEEEEEMDQTLQIHQTLEIMVMMAAEMEETVMEEKNKTNDFLLKTCSP